jgi:hypothetical protein
LLSGGLNLPEIVNANRGLRPGAGFEKPGNGDRGEQADQAHDNHNFQERKARAWESLQFHIQFDRVDRSAYFNPVSKLPLVERDLETTPLECFDRRNSAIGAYSEQDPGMTPEHNPGMPPGRWTWHFVDATFSLSSPLQRECGANACAGETHQGKSISRISL